MRLNKYLAKCGLGSRRKVEEFIAGGRVIVNGSPVKNPAHQVEEGDTVLFDALKVSLIERLHYIILNKPAGYITSLKDEKGRPIVMNIIPEKYRRDGVVPVGRLDKDSEGLLLLTNDGELANRLTHPRYKVTKEYHVIIDRPLEDRDRSKMEKGIFLHQIEKKTGRALYEPADRHRKKIRVVIKEGKKRQIRYTFQKFGYKVERLTRTAYGPLDIKGLPRGGHRSLKGGEIKLLKEAVKLDLP